MKEMPLQSENRKNILPFQPRISSTDTSLLDDNLDNNLDDENSCCLLSLNPQMKKILDVINVVSKYDSNVLIYGESGTGKSMLARLIHRMSPRSNYPFVEVNCGCLSENLLESELFGHVRGAFTGATYDKIGKFEASNNGTIFLDDINSASLTLQTKLLHVIQDRYIQRVGNARTTHLNTRLICASNRDLAREVEKKKFREDLFYRIMVVHLKVPPLRERTEEIIPLSNFFIKRFNKKYNKKIKGLTKDSKSKALAYSWAGNVRELENTIERAVVLSQNEWVELQIADVPRSATTIRKPPHSVDSLADAVQKYEKALIHDTLNTYDWNFQKTAHKLKIGRSTLFNKIKKYGIVRSG